MNLPLTPVSRRLAQVGCALLLALGAGACLAADASSRDPAPDPRAAHAEHHLQSHLDALAARLEIKASQEAAWQNFTKTWRDVMAEHESSMRAAPRPADEDAAALSREQAERAAARAKRLARIAEATAQLQQVLTPDQRLVLNEAARRFVEHAHEMRAAHFWHRGEDGGAHCGHKHGPWQGHGDDGAPDRMRPSLHGDALEQPAAESAS